MIYLSSEKPETPYFEDPCWEPGYARGGGESRRHLNRVLMTYTREVRRKRPGRFLCS
jgi:hypothetical protein